MKGPIDRRHFLKTSSALAAAWSACAPARQVVDPAAREWQHYGGDAGAGRYSPLDQINRTNVSESEGGVDPPDRGRPPAPGHHHRVHAHRGGWTHVRHHGHPERACAGCGHGPEAVEFRSSRRQAPARIPQRQPGRHLVGESRPAGRPPDLPAGQGHALLHRRRDREADARIRPGRGHRPEAGLRPRHDRTLLHHDESGGGVPGPDHRGRRRRGGSLPGGAGPHPGIRRRHRKAALDLPHHPPPGPVRQRHLGRRLVEDHGRHQQLGRHEPGPGAGLGLRLHRLARLRLLRGAIARAPTSSATASWRWTPPPGSGNGTSRPSTTTSGTTTCRASQPSST